MKYRSQTEFTEYSVCEGTALKICTLIPQTNASGWLAALDKELDRDGWTAIVVRVSFSVTQGNEEQAYKGFTTFILEVMVVT